MSPEMKRGWTMISRRSGMLWVTPRERRRERERGDKYQQMGGRKCHEKRGTIFLSVPSIAQIPYRKCTISVRSMCMCVWVYVHCHGHSRADLWWHNYQERPPFSSRLHLVFCRRSQAEERTHNDEEQPAQRARPPCNTLLWTMALLLWTHTFEIMGS